MPTNGMPRLNHAELGAKRTRLENGAATDHRRSHPKLSLSIQLDDQAGDCPVSRPQLRRWAQAALLTDARLTLRLVGLAEGRALNRQFRGRDYATNVLTFAYGNPVPTSQATAPIEADIIICLRVVAREARAQRKALHDHLAHLVVHGCLHAQGLDHETPQQAQEMEALETRLLARFRIADPYR